MVGIGCARDYCRYLGHLWWGDGYLPSIGVTDGSLGGVPQNHYMGFVWLAAAPVGGIIDMLFVEGLRVVCGLKGVIRRHGFRRRRLGGFLFSWLVISMFYK